MLTKVQNWGNSQGIRIPKAVLNETNIVVGDHVDVFAEADRIVIQIKNRIRGKYSIENLVSEIPAEYRSEVEDWGEPAGREVW